MQFEGSRRPLERSKCNKLKLASNLRLRLHQRLHLDGKGHRRTVRKVHGREFSSKITYDATGSGTGIESASNGSADIGLSSRELEPEEQEKGLKATPIALNGIAVTYPLRAPVKNLSLDQIKKIYTGEATNWNEVGGPNLDISPIGRENGSDTCDGSESITGTADKTVHAQELTSTGAVIEAVANNPNAIGYASLSAVEGKKNVSMFTVNGVICSEKTVQDGSSPIQRPFNLVTKNSAKLSPAAEAFYKFCLDQKNADLIRSAGAVPLAK